MIAILGSCSAIRAKDLAAGSAIVSCMHLPE